MNTATFSYDDEAQARRDMLAKRRHEQKRRDFRVGQSGPRFIKVPHKTRISTRGDVGQSWRTKRHTIARLRDIYELAEKKGLHALGDYAFDKGLKMGVNLAQ